MAPTLARPSTPRRHPCVCASKNWPLLLAALAAGALLWLAQRQLPEAERVAPPELRRAPDADADVAEELRAGRARAAAHAAARAACSFPLIRSRVRRDVGGAHVVLRSMQLWVSDRHRFIFVRFPKVASTTSMRLVERYGATVRFQGGEWDGVLPQKYARYFKFAFVRDPLERLVSSYNFRRPGDCRPPLPRCKREPRKASLWHKHGGGQHPAALRERALARFVASVSGGVATMATMDVHFKPQTPCLVRPDGRPRPLDFLGVMDGGPLYARGWKAVSLALDLKPPVDDEAIADATRDTVRMGRAKEMIPRSERGLLLSARNLSAAAVAQVCALYAKDYACLRAAGVPLDRRCAAAALPAANATAAHLQGGWVALRGRANASAPAARGGAAVPAANATAGFWRVGWAEEWAGGRRSVR